ncbi:PglZ domain-containing protein [Candidatus Accumulibacter meliphilus]|uniref:PglZ domain-containing protein n=1 Tax=Candidatus Accumulibacter meliphilus TaxID=2211374 RepID=UPI003DA7E1F2
MAHLDAGIRRVFVVISDAFRYEAAEELVRDINGKSRFKAALTAHARRAAQLYRARHGVAVAAPYAGLQDEQQSRRDGRRCRGFHA